MGPPGAQWSACTKTRCSKVAFVVKSKWSRFWETRWSVQFADVGCGVPSRGTATGRRRAATQATSSRLGSLDIMGRTIAPGGKSTAMKLA